MSGAVLSPCQRYRYRLERYTHLLEPLQRHDGTTFAYFGVNPSTADALVNDQTVLKWSGFARLHGARRFIVGNVFAWRATDIRALASAADPVGPDNPRHLRAIIDEADVLIPCWGARNKLPAVLRPHLDAMRARLFASGKPVKTFGFTRDGEPRHVLTLGYATPLSLWTLPASVSNGTTEVSA